MVEEEGTEGTATIAKQQLCGLRGIRRREVEGEEVRRLNKILFLELVRGVDMVGPERECGIIVAQDI